MPSHVLSYFWALYALGAAITLVWMVRNYIRLGNTVRMTDIAAITIGAATWPLLLSAIQFRG